MKINSIAFSLLAGLVLLSCNILYNSSTSVSRLSPNLDLMYSTKPLAEGRPPGFPECPGANLPFILFSICPESMVTPLFMYGFFYYFITSKTKFLIPFRNLLQQICFYLYSNTVQILSGRCLKPPTINLYT